MTDSSPEWETIAAAAICREYTMMVDTSDYIDIL